MKNHQKAFAALLTFLCAAEQVSLLVLWVSATASSSVPPRSPPGAGRARSGCLWWSGCKDSWRARTGRPRCRTKPRDWCSSGRWDAGPSDNLWSEKDGGEGGETRRAETGGEEGRCWRRARRFSLASLALPANQRLHSGTFKLSSHSLLPRVRTTPSPLRS